MRLSDSGCALDLLLLNPDVETKVLVESSAPGLGAGGRRFKSFRPDHFFKKDPAACPAFFRV